MFPYLLRRLGQALVLLLIVSMLGFAILHLAPGGPLSQFALSSQMSPEDIARIAKGHTARFLKEVLERRPIKKAKPAVRQAAE